MEFVNGEDDKPYIMEKMFQTTNQILLTFINIY